MRARMTYANVAEKYKIKVYDVVRDDLKIAMIHERVEMCRAYINTFAWFIEEMQKRHSIDEAVEPF